jgi:predicted O-methyltransferase YrrM
MPLTSSNRSIKQVIELGKRVAFRYTSLGAPNYPYNIEPIQLTSLIAEIERMRGVEGSILEIGVARGMTTRFMAEHIALSGSIERLVAIDTFASFVEEDVAYEVRERGKSAPDIAGFAYNDYDVWTKNFRRFPFVEAIKADCTVVDYKSLSPIKIVFLDVDLYQPTKKTLPKIFEELVDGGVILLDDIAAGGAYDGAHQAYVEFCIERELPQQIIGNKCGVIRKNPR